MNETTKPQCPGCAVAQGTHAPAGALHNIADNANPILQLADEMAAAHAISVASAKAYPEQAQIHADRVAEIRARLVDQLAAVQYPERPKGEWSREVVQGNLVIRHPYGDSYEVPLSMLTGQLAAVQQEVQPYAVLVFERGEEGPFDRKPVKPESVQHLHAKRDPHYDYIELYTHPTQQGLEQPWLQERHLTALKRFQETTDDSQPYDISNNFIKHLLAIGCLQNHGFGKYSITEFGNYVLNSWDGARELPFKSQIERDGEGYAAQAKQAEALQAARNGGCGCCGNACADRADGCRFVHESPSAADMTAAQAKQGEQA